MLNHRNQRKCHITLVVVIDKNLKKVVGMSLRYGLFTVRGKQSERSGIIGGYMKDKDT